MPTRMLHPQGCRSRMNALNNPPTETILPDFKTLLEDLSSGPETFFWSSSSSSSSLLGSPYCGGGTDEGLSPYDGDEYTSGILNEALDLDLHQTRLESFNDIWGKSLRWTDEYSEDTRLEDSNNNNNNDSRSINSTLEREVQYKIDRACTKLHISSNPKLWTQEQVRSWMRWTLCKFSPPGGDIYEQDWLFDGEQLCRLTLREFELRLHHDAEMIYAELELWKSEHERRMNTGVPSTNVLPSTSHDVITRSRDEAELRSRDEAELRSRDEVDLSYRMLDRMVWNTSQPFGANNIVYSSMPRLCGGTSRYVPSGTSDSLPFSLPPHTLQRFFDSLDVPTERNIQMSLNNAYTDYVGTLDRHLFSASILDRNNPHDVSDFHRNNTEYQSSGGCGDSGEKLIEGSSVAGFAEESGVRVKLECYNRDEDAAYGVRSNAQSYAERCNVQLYGGDVQSDDDSWTQNVVSSDQLLSQDIDGQYEDRSRTWSACSNVCPADKMAPLYTSQSSSSSSSSSSVTSRRGKRTICLWQFLKELLLLPQSYQTWIRWLDANRGIFKIEDSMRVARLWGERKNRPAMNYDKLSRSIRQYYRKGIIQKTSNSKRLVYQFCPQYM